MKLNQFFKTLVNALFGSDNRAKAKPLTPAQQRAEKRELMQKPELLAEAQRAGNARRLAAWKRSCEGGYRAAIRKGRGGVPRWFLIQEGIVKP